MEFDPNGGLPDDSEREITPETESLRTSWQAPRMCGEFRVSWGSLFLRGVGALSMPESPKENLLLQANEKMHHRSILGFYCPG